jgi:malate/lactate dehydrogenase
MKRSVGIIGTGWVGSSVAICTLHSGAVDELLLNDLKLELAEGEAMDLAHGASYYPTAAVRAATVAEMLDTDALVIAAGRGGQPGRGICLTTMGSVRNVPQWVQMVAMRTPRPRASRQKCVRR